MAFLIIFSYLCSPRKNNGIGLWKGGRENREKYKYKK